ncbi:MAG: ATP-dependent DNA helicase [Actinomycetaceae bacterium]|nr:ATP-dependent DNA helicase [Actinomycetaceae bacterium]
MITPAELAERTGDFPPTFEQTEVITAPLQPQLVVAGAGSGKTATMAMRALYQVANEIVKPEHILGLTFTNKAAGELQERIENKIIAGTDYHPEEIALDPPQISTYNAFAGMIVRDYGLRAGIDPDARLITDAEKWQIIHNIVANWNRPLNTTKTLDSVVGDVMELASVLTDNALDLDIAAAEMRAYAATIEEFTDDKGKSPRKDVLAIATTLKERGELLEIVREYWNAKKTLGVIEFADQVALANRILRTNKDVVGEVRARFKSVFLDEFQDTSPNQVEMLARLFAGHGVVAVGDPNQSIYGWRGASRAALDGFATAFGATTAPLNLSISFRNDKNILKVANITAKKLGAPKDDTNPAWSHAAGIPQVSLPALQSHEKALAGTVLGAFFASEKDEDEAVAKWFAAHWNRASTAAVLCRNRRTMVDVRNALEKEGVAAVIVGTAGLLYEPAVIDLVSALTVATDARAGDALMRLLTGKNLGAKDLARVWEKALEIAKSGCAPDEHPDAVLAEAVEAVRFEDDPHLSPTANVRVRQLANALAQIRTHLHGGLVALVQKTINALDLDIDAALDPSSLQSRALNAFKQVAASFATESSNDVRDFLAWLEAAEARERGLEGVSVEPAPGVVQILTMHAAKGLEWDTVAVVRLGESKFPKVSLLKEKSKKKADLPPYRSANGWLTVASKLPFFMRTDRQSLPQLAVETCVTSKDINALRDQYVRVLGEFETLEERRLAYVAFTRACHQLVLTGSTAWGRKNKDGEREPLGVSEFLGELIEAGAVTGLPGVATTFPDAAQLQEWFTEPAPPRSLWPRPRTQLGKSLGELAAAVENYEGAAPDSPAVRQALSLADNYWAGNEVTVQLPAYLATTKVQQAYEDLTGFAWSLRRPLPQPASEAMLLGTVFHAWVESQLGQSAAEPRETDLISDLRSAQLRRLQKWQSNWEKLHITQNYRTLAVETGLSVLVKNVRINAKIDAVFEKDGRVVIMDWKTGRPPIPEDAARAKIQLHIYRLAWAQAHEMPLRQIAAQLVYVSTGTVVRLGDDEIWDENQIAAQLGLDTASPSR